MNTERIDKEIKSVWVAWTNTDLTEGRGQRYPLAVCELKTTAERLGKGKDVQGTDCNVTREIAIKRNGRWLSCVRIHPPTKEDEKQQKKIDKQKTIEEKALQLGLTQEEINLIKKG